MKTLLFFTSIFLFFNTSCNDLDNSAPKVEESIAIIDKAEIVSISVSGEENNYNFSVGISSPDTGCEQYANWWEIISEDGSTLIYRRILGHSHVNEQPFVRSGSVSIPKNKIVIIRAHMNTSGYGTKVYKGSVESGFITTELTADFAEELATKSPLPSGCTS